MSRRTTKQRRAARRRAWWLRVWASFEAEPERPAVPRWPDPRDYAVLAVTDFRYLGRIRMEGE